MGDVHGRLDLLLALVEAIETDNEARDNAQSCVIMLGDLIDRGPDSAKVVAAARIWGEHRKVRILMGNHEEMLLRALESDEIMRHFLRYGGRETVLSYLSDHAAYHRTDLAGARALTRTAIPDDDLDFIRSFEDTITVGDYLFVHAGVHPDAAMDEQRTGDLRWIREPFLSHGGSFGPVVVHGHTITEKPEIKHNRIGLDTGAYRSGCLTAMGLQGTERWLIEAQDNDGAIATAIRSIG